MNFIYVTIVYFALIFLTIILSRRYSFYDFPNDRKIHKKKIINTAGLSLYIFLLIIISLYEYSYELELIISYGIFLVFFGFLDDRISLNASIKIICIFFPVIFLIFNGFELKSLGDYEIIGSIGLGKLSIIFTLLSVGLLINAYNYTDGIDGLLSSLSITLISYIIFLIDNKDVINLLYLFLIPLIINLIFNILPSSNAYKIFLGDCGSLFLGFFLSFLIIYTNIYENIHPSYLIWSCWYPVYDFLYVTFNRIFNKKNFYQPDNSHLHHVILKKFKNNHLKTMIFISLINIFIIICGFLIAKNIGQIYSLLSFVLLYLAFWKIREKIKS